MPGAPANPQLRLSSGNAAAGKEAPYPDRQGPWTCKHAGSSPLLMLRLLRSGGAASLSQCSLLHTCTESTEPGLNLAVTYSSLPECILKPKWRGMHQGHHTSI